ncbi:hypothetical protein D3C81_2276790 [compost metagenome]
MISVYYGSDGPQEGEVELVHLNGRKSFQQMEEWGKVDLTWANSLEKVELDGITILFPANACGEAG